MITSCLGDTTKDKDENEKGFLMDEFILDYEEVVVENDVDKHRSAEEKGSPNLLSLLNSFSNRIYRRIS
jgi:hypothetical protein